jgi:rod shape-determining protein MreC
MDHSPPPFFRQGPSANARLLFFSLLAITMLVIDSRAQTLSALRKGVATALFPVQKALLVPRDVVAGSANQVGNVITLQNENTRLKNESIANATTLQRVEQLDAENRELRKLLELREKLTITTVMAQVLYEARDPFVRRLVLDKGSQDGILAGQPVVDAVGVVGQITRVFPISSEVTVLNDAALTVPVQIQRSGVRAVAFGGGSGGNLELRYLAANADVKPGDLVTTSGLDGLYPSGLVIGRVVSIDSRKAGNFMPATVEPSAGLQRSRTLAVVMVDKSRLPPPPPPVTEDAGAVRKKRSSRAE